jgi:dihydrolipoamide dehydrogenase
MISELTLAVSLGLKANILADMIHPHPTLSEAIMEACGDAVGRSIHKAK